MDKIAILFNLNRHQFDYETEFDLPITIESICNSLKDEYEIKLVEAVKDFSWIKEIIDFNPKLVFNICEGYCGPARESVYAAILEQLNFNYSGPDSTNLLMCHNKNLTKKLLESKILVPKGYCVTNIEQIKNFKWDFPLIVKLNSEGSSLGMSEKSIVHNFQELSGQVKEMIQKFKRGVLIEEFIDGKDISMIFIEGLGALGPCEVECDAAFYDYDMKSIKDDTVDIRELKGDYLDLKNIVKYVAQALDIKGYAKLDFRVKDGKYYLIEVNSQVSFHPNGEFITCAKTDGYSFEQVVNHIVTYALRNKIKKNSIGIGVTND